MRPEVIRPKFGVPCYRRRVLYNTYRYCIDSGRCGEGYQDGRQSVRALEGNKFTSTSILGPLLAKAVGEAGWFRDPQQVVAQVALYRGR